MKVVAMMIKSATEFSDAREEVSTEEDVPAWHNSHQ